MIILNFKIKIIQELNFKFEVITFESLIISSKSLKVITLNFKIKIVQELNQ